MKTKFPVVCLICCTLLINGAKKGYEPGDIADDFNLKNTDGKMISMGKFENARGFIVIFDCNSCPYSKAYNGRIIALNKKYMALGFPVIAINSNDPSISPDDSFDEMVKEAKQKNYSFPYLFDETQSVARMYGATNTPHVYVLKKENGQLVVSYIGTIDDNARDASAVTKKYVENAVNALLENKPITVKRTKALGCGIKWKNS